MEMFVRCLPIYLLFAVAVSGLCPGRTLYVDSNATGNSDGTSWQNSFNHLQDALAEASGGDEIRIARGTYYSDTNSANPAGTGDRQAVFYLLRNVTIRGGYAGVSYADPDDRDILAYETILSGDLADNDAWIGDLQTFFSDITHDDNSFNVVVADNVDTSSVLDGLTITGGNADTFSNVSGAVHITGGGLTVTRCRLVGNLGGIGGAIGCFGSGSTVVSNCLIGGNWASDCGGGAYIESGLVEFRNCAFSGNSAEDWGGGGIFQSDGTSRFINCTFSGNWASDGGSGVYVSGGSAEFVSCIAYEQISIHAATADFRYCNVPEGIPGEGNIHTDPNFVDANGIDNIFGTADDGLMLFADSPCIDAGDPNRVLLDGETDLANDPRIVKDRIDIGAYEFSDNHQLVANWKFDETQGTVAKDSVGDNDGDLVGWVSWHPEDGRINGAAGFEGVEDYINCGNGGDLGNIRDQITVCAWIKVDEFTRQWQAIVTKGDSAWRLQGAGHEGYPGALEFACSGLDVPGNSWGSIEGSIKVDDGLWHHAAGIYDGSRISLYVDGILDVASTASGRINVNDYDVLIGENAERTGRYWKGMIDDVRIYDSALAPEEIALLASASATYHVDINGGSDLNDGLARQRAFKSITAAVAQADTGDAVLVWPGVYNEEVYFRHEKPITLKSAADAAVIELDDQKQYAFTFQFGEGPDSVLSNFVIRNSTGAVFCNGSSPTIRNLTIAGNDFGIVVYGGGKPDIHNCIFWNNADGNIFREDDSDMKGLSLSHYNWDWTIDNAVARWRMDEAEGAVIFDSAGASHGTVCGDVFSVRGQMAGALQFDGDLDYVLIPDNPAITLGDSDYTISAWIRPKRVDSVHVILGKMTGSTDKEYLLYIDQRRFRLDVENNDNNGRTYSQPVVRPDSWQHVGVVFNRSALAATFYHNGVPVSTGETSLPITMPPDDLSGNLCIGMRSDMSLEDRAFEGQMDDITIFDHALTAEQMQVVYYSTLNPGFADPHNGDYHLLSEKGRYVPLDPTVNNGIEGLWAFDKVTSICVDSGDPQEAPFRERSPNGGRVNLGAYGDSPYASMSTWPLKGDINRDGAVDIRDIAAMAADWLNVLPWAYGSQGL